MEARNARGRGLLGRLYCATALRVASDDTCTVIYIRGVFWALQDGPRLAHLYSLLVKAPGALSYIALHLACSVNVAVRHAIAVEDAQ